MIPRSFTTLSMFPLFCMHSRIARLSSNTRWKTDFVFCSAFFSIGYMFDVRCKYTTFAFYCQQCILLSTISRLKSIQRPFLFCPSVSVVCSRVWNVFHSTPFRYALRTGSRRSKGVKKGFKRSLQPSARDTLQHLRQTPVAICGRCLTWSAADGEGGLQQMLEPLCRRCPRLLVRLC